MKDCFRKSLTGAFAVISVVFTFVPEALFGNVKWVPAETLAKCEILSNSVVEVNVTINKVLFFVAAWIVCTLVYVGVQKARRWITFKGNNYIIRVEYGNIFKVGKCKTVIPFDECFTTKVGNDIADINPDSICGQYLAKHPELDIQALIESSGVKKARAKSRYQNLERYESGTIIPNEKDLLLVFAKLDERGKGYLTREEYLDCLAKLWEELEYHYGQEDVCVPILGSGTTKLEGGSGASIPQQELLDMMIWSYKLSNHKIKAPNKLRIICREKDDFSINEIEA